MGSQSGWGTSLLETSRLAGFSKLCRTTTLSAVVLLVCLANLGGLLDNPKFLQDTQLLELIQRQTVDKSLSANRSIISRMDINLQEGLISSVLKQK